MITLSKNASEFLNQFEGAIDGFIQSDRKFDVQKMIFQNKLKTEDVLAVQEKLKSQTEDFELAVIGGDAQVVEAYKHLSKAKLRDILEKYHTIMELKLKKTKKVKAENDVKPSKVKKTREVKPTVDTENFNSVFVICGKYNCVRAFVGNVKLTGVNVVADQMETFGFGKNVDVESWVTATEDELKSYIKDKKPAARSNNTISGSAVTAVLKF